jgi:quinoprotein dehydrogenase-associated probable ABC transporter substrate-binding protein
VTPHWLAAIAVAASLAALPAWGQGPREAPGREARETEALRVCADPNNLPFSNQAEQGFENRIVRLLADELKRPLTYFWFPQTAGFVRNTLLARRCDLIPGIAAAQETVQSTNPYYRSVYAMVHRAGGIAPTGLADPRLKTLQLGVIAGTPPASALAHYGLLGRVRPYHLMVDTRHDAPARQAIEDVASGETDVAMIWGPIAGYFAPRQKVALKVAPLLDAGAAVVRLDFRIAMGVRHNEPEWKHELNDALQRLQPRIDAMLREYGVPLLDESGRLIP